MNALIEQIRSILGPQAVLTGADLNCAVISTERLLRVDRLQDAILPSGRRFGQISAPESLSGVAG